MKAGTHRLSGNEACAEGAIAAGCRFLGVYPIVPALEVVERFLKRCPEIGATFVQMEDEISVLAAVLGASWTGKKAMTVTSGPGFSLMMEHLGLGVMLETPCVIVDVQRGGPSEGMPNSPSQGDMMQARWGSHGDYEIVALCPNSPQEMFDFTIKAFNLSEKYRIPVVVMADEAVGHMTDNVVIPNKIELVSRKYYKGKKDKYLPFLREPALTGIPSMVDIGNGYKFHVTGLTHDERGYPIMNAECQEFCVRPLMEKIRKNVDEIVEFEEKDTNNAEIVVLSYGITSRVAEKAMDLATKDGIKVGFLRPIVVWPFPEKKVRELSKKIKAFAVPEINYGQIVYEVERCAGGNCNIIFVPSKSGAVHEPEEIVNAIKMGIKEEKREEVIQVKISNQQ